MDVALPWDENAPLPKTPERMKETEKDQEKKKSPLPETPERMKDTEKAQESEAGESAAAAKARDHGVGSFWKTLWATLAAIATIMLLVFMSTTQLPNAPLAAWGNNQYGQKNVPSGTDFVAIAAGWGHSLALRKDGSIAAWGSNKDGETNVPSGNDFVAIAAGGSHSLALRKDGSIAAWGRNAEGQTNVPAGTDFVAIAAGGSHSLALRKDGSLAAWGANGEGHTNVPAGTDFVAIAAGGLHSLALRKNGSIVTWGYNKDGQTNVPSGTNFVAIAAGGWHSLALRGDASVREALSARLNTTTTERNVRESELSGLFGKHSESPDHTKTGKPEPATPGLSERDNIGTRYETQGKVEVFWAPYTFGRPSFPYIFYDMPSKKDAIDAMLSLPPFKIAADSGKLISTEILQFGVYPAERDGVFTVWGFFIAGDQITLDLYNAAIASCEKYNGTNPRVSNPPEASAAVSAAVSPASSKADLASATFDREEKVDTMKHMQSRGMTFTGPGAPTETSFATMRHYKAPDKETALAFLKANPVHEALLYIVVHTPNGDFRRDIDGIF